MFLKHIFSEVNVSNLLKIIKKYFKNEYFLNVAVLFYIKNIDKSLSKISTLLGFEDSDYFTKNFKKLTRITLSQYRKN